MTKRARTFSSFRRSSRVKARLETGDSFAPSGMGPETPRLDAALRALVSRDDADLCSLRIAALAFKLVVRGAHPIAVAHAVDDEGAEHWLAIRATDAAGSVELAYAALLSDLVQRGLVVTRPLIVDADGYPGLARRLELAFGPVVYAGAIRDLGGCGLAW